MQLCVDVTNLFSSAFSSLTKANRGGKKSQIFQDHLIAYFSSKTHEARRKAAQRVAAKQIEMRIKIKILNEYQG